MAANPRIVSDSGTYIWDQRARVTAADVDVVKAADVKAADVEKRPKAADVWLKAADVRLKAADILAQSSRCLGQSSRCSA